jgi:tetratricopeptide (TPR) repeat protein
MLVPAQRSLGLLNDALGRSDGALGHFEDGIATADKLLQVEHDNTVWLDDAFELRLSYADVLLGAGRTAAAQEQARAGCAIVDQLLRRDSSFPGWRAGARDCQRLNARLALASNQPGAAVAAATRAVTIGQSVRGSDPVADQSGLAASLRVLGDAQARAGRREQAAQAWQQAYRSLPSGAGERPTELAERMVILQRLGRVGEAERLNAQLARMKGQARPLALAFR